MTDTNKLKELAKRATPGPWGRSGSDICTQRKEDGTTYVECWNVLGYVTRHENADYVAAANPQAILGLIAEVERLHIVAESAWSKADEFGNKMFWQNWDQAKHGGFENVLAERDRLKAENEALRQFAAEAYQVLGALDAPENVLDNASDAAGGAPLRHKTLLPFFAEGYEALRKDAERYRWLKDQGHFRAMSIDMGGNHAWTGMGRNVGCGPTVDDAIDAALEGGAK